MRHGAKITCLDDVKFQSTHPLRGATRDSLTACPCAWTFQSTHPLRGATRCPGAGDRRHVHFNPRTPCGVRHDDICPPCAAAGFQSTHPLRGATRQTPQPAWRQNSFQSTHPLRGATRQDRRSCFLWDISIHAPLAGCDRHQRHALGQPQISIHAPLAGCDCPLKGWKTSTRAFQSTHPLRGATAKTYKENCTFFELADKLSARIAAKKPSAKADRCA